MPDGMIKVGFAQIAEASANIGSTAKTVDSLLDDLKSRLNPIRESYTGEARAAWEATQQQWDTAAADLNQVLAQIGTAVQQAGENYQAAEKANVSRWG
jgi:early secretory antigenic target protein ESAT-6